MKLKFKTEGLTGDQLAMAQKMNELFAQLPEQVSNEDIVTELKKQLPSLFKEDGTGVNVKELMDSLTDETKEGSLKFILKAQGNEINALKQKLERGEGAQVKSIKELLEEKKEQLKAIKANRSGAITIQMKDAGITSFANSTVSGGAPVANPYFPLPVDSGRFVDIRKPHLFILNYIDQGETNSAAILWTEETTSTFGAAIVTEGALKPLADQKAIRRVSNYKKAAARITITEELEKDEPRLITQFKRLFNDKVDRKYNYQVLADIIAIAPGYVSTTLNGVVQNPDDFGAIAAGISQCQSLEFMPDSLFINPSDLWRMCLVKDSVGQYVIPPFVTITNNGIQYGNLKLEVTTQVAPGNFLLGEAKTYKIDVYEDYTLRIGFVNDDFAKNQYSAVGEIKFHSYIATNEIGAWFYAAFDTVKAAIAIAPAA